MEERIRKEEEVEEEIMVEGSCVSARDLLAREERVLFMWESFDNSTIFISLGREDPQWSPP